jgi:hypothetical protein
MRRRPLIFVTLMLPAFMSRVQAQDDLSVTPKGYDESFETGDIPKPKEPELDPDLANEDELNPDKISDSNDGHFDHSPDQFMIGGTAGLTLPHVLNFGIDTVIWQRFGVAINYGNATRNLDSIDVGVRHTDIRFRWFPWAGSFFAGVAFGSQTLTGDLNRVIKESSTKQDIAVRGHITASANYFAPHFGWFSVWDSGFTMGCDFGYLTPAGVKSNFSSTFAGTPSGVSDDTLRESSEFKEMQKDLENSAKKYASTPLPFATLMRIGWMF